VNDSFAWQSILKLKLFSFSTQSTSFNSLLAFKLSVEKSAVILMGLHYMFFIFYLSQPSKFFLFSVPVVLMIICLGRFYFGHMFLVSWRLLILECAKLS
jgi:hypothetical protein